LLLREFIIRHILEWAMLMAWYIHWWRAQGTYRWGYVSQLRKLLTARVGILLIGRR
jgi:hypothetical protein